MSTPTTTPNESQGRGSFLVKNVKQITGASDPATAQTTQKQSDVKAFHALTPDQPGDASFYSGRFPPPAPGVSYS
jgi:hypothetical protein